METQEDFAKAERETGESGSPSAANLPPTRRPSWVEVLLDPKTLNGLMACGGTLLVLGLVIWLWSIGLFENKIIVASCLGVANAALLAVGILGTRFSPYQTASKALTLLACLVMPLNLWFYDAQGLITLDQGGHLWVPALVCCAIYVFVARVLADPHFVHAIVGGVVMTGLLFLADSQIGKFWEIMAPSTFLVMLGILCIHLERAFSPEAGPFSRANFGRAFFQAGHLVMGLGLTVLLVGRLIGRLYEPLFTHIDWLTLPEVATQANLKILAIALALGAAYSYIYSLIVVDARGRYLLSAILTITWSAIILLDLLQVAFTLELAMLLVALTGLLTSLAAIADRQTAAEEEQLGPMASLLRSLTRASDNWSKVLNLATLGLGMGLYCRARIDVLFAEWPYELSGLFLLAAILGGIACWVAARPMDSTANVNRWQVQIGALLAWLGFEASLALLGFEFSTITLVAGALLPLGFAVGSLLATTKNVRIQAALVAETMMTLLLAVGLSGAFGLLLNSGFAQSHFGLAAFFTEAAVCLALASRVSSRRLPAALAALSICGATWQLLLWLGVTRYVFILAATIIGIVCLGSSYLLRRSASQPSQFAVVSQWTGRLCISYTMAATLLIALSRLLTGETDGTLLAVLIVQLLAGGIAGLISPEAVWRRHFWVLTTVQLLMTVLVANALTTLTFWQRGEIMLTVLGLTALVTGYYGWSRERDCQQDWVSFNLAIGSLLSAGPLVLGMLVQRFDNQLAEWGWVLVHEAGVLAIGLLLLGAGVLCRIRWSTIVGGSTLLIYVISLVGLIRLPDQLQTTSIYMMIGGGLFFAVAIVLSIYRDRLLAIPKRVEAGQGVFRVLKWR